jgi:hypothetical protein
VARSRIGGAQKAGPSLGARREPRDIWSKEMCQKLSAAATAAYVYFKADDSS